MPGQNILFVANKQDTAQNPATLPTVFRQIERWANGLTFGGGGGITQITSVDGSVTIVNPTGPVVDLHVASGGGGGLYASLTGPGQTVTPGDLTQTGGFTITGGLTVNNTTSTGIRLYDHSTTGGAGALTGAGINISSDHGQLNIVAPLVVAGSNEVVGGYPTYVTSGMGTGASTLFNRVAVWINDGPPNVVSTLGGQITPLPVGTANYNFCFNINDGSIWAGTTVANWRQISV